MNIDYVSFILIIGLFLIGGVVYVALKGHKTNIGQRVKEHSSELFQRYLIIAESVVETTVIKLNETLVKEYKKASEDGKLTPEEGKVIFETAIRQIKLILGSVFIEFVSGFIGDFDEWLKQEIEKYVAMSKANYNVNDLYNDLKKEGILK